MTTDLEAIPEEVVVISELKKVPKEEAELETVGAWEDRLEDQRLYVLCQNPRKRWTSGYLARGAPGGPTFEKRRQKSLECNIGIKD
jgi:hypothetical protein